jgi:nucleotide-binding universal stress UspA family protein
MNVLVAVEESKHSEKALEYAVDMAKRYEAKLTALCIAEVIEDLDGMHQIAEINAVLMHKCKDTAKRVNEYADSHEIKIVTVIMAEPSPADCILSYEKNNKISVIVVGSRAKNRLEKFLLGSVAYKVVRHAGCSVVVVR